MKQPLNEQFIRMQKLAGIITESKYREDIQETTLSPEEQKIVDDIAKANPGKVFAIKIHAGSFAPDNPNYKTTVGTAIDAAAGITGYPSGSINR
jgi:hypothetical protein